jgi:glycosyltransferase involved in cell wall biosynthesis
MRYLLHEGLPVPSKLDENPTVLYTGSLYEAKGVYVLAQAAKHIQGVDVFLQGGPPEEYERLSKFVSNQGLSSVVVRPHIPPLEVPALQQSASILAYTPTGEDVRHERYTSPIKLYEYMASGRAIVSTDLPSIREVLAHEETALLVRPNDPAAVADAVNRLLSDPELAQRLARNARCKVEEFTWQNRVRQLLDAINPDYLSISKVYA